MWWSEKPAGAASVLLSEFWSQVLSQRQNWTGHSFALTRPCLRESPSSLGHAAQILCPCGPALCLPASPPAMVMVMHLPPCLYFWFLMETLNSVIILVRGVTRVGGKLGRTGPLEILHHCGLTSVISLYSNIIFCILIPMIASDFIIIWFPKGHKE